MASHVTSSHDNLVADLIIARDGALGETKKLLRRAIVRLESLNGLCNELLGNGVTCPRCKQAMDDADAAEGCEDHACPFIGGCK